jgi:hypothetical protein
LANGKSLSAKSNLTRNGQILEFAAVEISDAGLYRCSDGTSVVEIRLAVEGLSHFCFTSETSK